MEAKLIFLVLLGPISAAYDFVTNPAAPPQIFAAQYEDSFGHPPGANLPPRPKPAIHKHVYVTRVGG